MLIAEFGTGEMFWSIFWFYLFVLLIWLLIAYFRDIFRSPDLSGLSKALWVLFLLVAPFIGILVYCVVRGSGMRERATHSASSDWLGV